MPKDDTQHNELTETLTAPLITNTAELSFDFPSKTPKMPFPHRLLMCRPEYFDVIDTKNPFMEGNIGRVDRQMALQQWEDLRTIYGRLGIAVDMIDPLVNSEDMVFCANPVFSGIAADRRKICVLSQMRHESRGREGPVVAQHLSKMGYELATLPRLAGGFEGGGDALWHPARQLIWGGYGQRTDRAAYSMLSRLFKTPIICLELAKSEFYHLDTCLCLLDERTALFCPSAFTADGNALLRKAFHVLIEATDEEARGLMACNAAAFLGRHVLIQQGANRINALLRRLGFDVVEVDTGEFIKSGGSVFCMKAAVF